MTLIGIISSYDDYKFIKNEINKKTISTKIEMVYISQKNIVDVKNKKFDTIVICEDKKCIHQTIKELINNSNYLIINTDDIKNNNYIKCNETQIITYGMNQKATVTVSSIKDDKILICLQRNILNIKGKIIEIQEFEINSDGNNKNIYNLIVSSIINILYN